MNFIEGFWHKVVELVLKSGCYNRGDGRDLLSPFMCTQSVCSDDGVHFINGGVKEECC